MRAVFRYSAARACCVRDVLACALILCSPNGRNCPRCMAARARSALRPSRGAGWHGRGDALYVVLFKALTKEDLRIWTEEEEEK